jgi:hypothetical protein
MTSILLADGVGGIWSLSIDDEGRLSVAPSSGTPTNLFLNDVAGASWQIIPVPLSMTTAQIKAAPVATFNYPLSVTFTTSGGFLYVLSVITTLAGPGILQTLSLSSGFPNEVDLANPKPGNFLIAMASFDDSGTGVPQVATLQPMVPIVQNISNGLGIWYGEATGQKAHFVFTDGGNNANSSMYAMELGNVDSVDFNVSTGTGFMATCTLGSNTLAIPLQVSGSWEFVLVDLTGPGGTIHLAMLSATPSIALLFPPSGWQSQFPFEPLDNNAFIFRVENAVLPSGSFAFTDPPFMPLPTYGCINEATFKMGRDRPEAR